MRRWFEPIPAQPTDRCAICGTSAILAETVDIQHARSPAWTIYDPVLAGKYKCIDEFDCVRRQGMNMVARGVLA